MWLNEAPAFKYLNSETIKKSEEKLQFELNELKREIETNELVYGLSFTRPFTSVPPPRDALQLSRERKLYIERLLRVHNARPTYIQADIMQEQIETATREENTLDSLPIILHQFFLDKLSWSIHAKHAHMLRWKRFAEHSSVIEELYVNFKNRMGYILSEYNDSIQRAKRLSVARDSLINNGSSQQASGFINIDDIEIYLRWLISHFYSQKSFQQSMKILEWLPYHMSIQSFSESHDHNANSNSEEAPAATKAQVTINTGRKSTTQPSTESSSLNPAQNENPSSGISSFYKTPHDTPTNMNKSNASSSITNTLINKSRLLDKLYTPNSNAFPAYDQVLNAISYTFSQDDLPVHNNSIDYLEPRLRYLVSNYKIDFDLNRMHTSGDEMELLAAVNRKFRHIFAKQEHMKAFRVYDIAEVTTENWGADSPMHALKKEANWLEFIQLVPMADYTYEKDISRLKLKQPLDEFLLKHTSFIEINNDERVQEAMRENAILVKNQPKVESVSVTTSPNGFNTNAVWKKIFSSTGSSSNHDGNLDVGESNESSTDNSLLAKAITFRSKSGKKSDDFNFVENLQKLGLDDNGTNGEQNFSNIQGSYLSFLLLRHLKIRDLKRQALGLLNYFRSVERTLTIYDGGLSFEAKNYKRQNAQNHMKETPFGGNLGYHAYIYNTPKDFRLSEAEFMEFAEIENHDDYYTLDEKGNIHVQDQRGYYIMYDVAMEDFTNLEKELLAIASYYIMKDKETYTSSGVHSTAATTTKSTTTASESSRRRTRGASSVPNETNLGMYSHQNVDRFAVLMDLWTNEVNFLEAKKNLFDLYFESYQNVFDKNERRNLSQVLTNLIYKRVRFDLEANYFTTSYRLEVSCLFKQAQIVKLILDKMVGDMRDMMEKIEDDRKFGVPYSIIKKNPICLTANGSGCSLNNLYLLEYHPCLGMSSRIPGAVKHAVEELLYFKTKNTVNDVLKIEESFLSTYYTHLATAEPPGSSYTMQLQKDLFHGILVEDPLYMTDLAQALIKQAEESTKNKTKKEQSEQSISVMTKILEMVTLRHRLIVAAMETETLAKIYRHLAVEMGLEEYHMYLRYVQFDFAKFKENADQPPPMFVNDLSPEDPQIDKYIPANLYLAIHELEEGQIGRFSFKSKESLQQILRPGGIENLQLVLKLQLSHNNALISSIMQAHSCIMNSNLMVRKVVPSISVISGSTVSHLDGFKKRDDSNKLLSLKNINPVQTSLNLNPNASIGSNMTAGSSGPKASNAVGRMPSRLKKYSDAFISIQLEKNPYRDRMLNAYLAQRESKGLILSNPVEMEKLKRNLMSTFATHFSNRMIQYSLRSQLISLYYSICKILENFPNTRDNHFVFGEPYEQRPQTSRSKKNTPSLHEAGGDNSDTKSIINDESIEYLKPDPRTFKKRPRKLLSEDGERLLNIWYIPHYTEILSMYKKNNSDEFCVRTLRHCVRILAAFNDILNFFYANACMNLSILTCASGESSTAQFRRKIDFSSWESAGGLDTELNEIQNEMNCLLDPCDPEQVIELLELKRSSLILQYDCALRYAVRDIFLANGNVEAYKIVDNHMHFALKYLSDMPFDTCENTYLSLPEPLDPRDYISNKLLPWRTFISKNGPFSLHYWPGYINESNLVICLSGLRDIDKNIANGEILGLSLIMEDLLIASGSPTEAESSTHLGLISEAHIGAESVVSMSSNVVGKNMGGTAMSTTHSTGQMGAASSVNINLNENPSGKQSNSGLASVSAVLNESNALMNQPAKKRFNPIGNYTKWIEFLVTWKRLELLKLDWGRRKLGVENINNEELFAKFCESYRKDILIPVLKVLIRKPENREVYENVVDYKQPILLPPDVSEYESKTKQMTRLLERLEQYMIDETLQRVQKEAKLVQAERGREENTITNDLWKKSIMKEEFTINRPHIADQFGLLLNQVLKPNDSASSTSDAPVIYSITESDLKDCLVKLGGFIQERERSNFEQYTMFYENLLRQQHQLLYLREREVLSLTDILEKKVAETNVEVQCQMADVCYDIIMEVTALRARITELNENRENIEKELRNKIRTEFIDVISDLVNVNINLRSQIDYFKESMHSTVVSLVTIARKEAVEKITKLKKNFHLEIDSVTESHIRKKEDQINKLQTRCIELENALIKQQNSEKTTVNQLMKDYTSKLIALTEESNRNKRKSVDLELINEQKQILNNQKHQALRSHLTKLEVEYNNLKQKLDKELKEKISREHEAKQKMRNEKNLSSAKQSNVEKLFEELETKDIELRNLHITTEKTSKMQSLNDTKIQRELTNLKKSLLQERNLKLEAFQRVDSLQSHVYDLEDELTNIVQVPGSRPQTSASNIRALRTNLSSAHSSNKFSSPFPRLNTFTSNLITSLNSAANNGNANSIDLSSINGKQGFSVKATSLLGSRPKTAARFTINKSTIMSTNNNETTEDPISRDLRIYHETVSKLRTVRIKSAKS